MLAYLMHVFIKHICFDASIAFKVANTALWILYNRL